ncbi:MAG: RNA methyltransferase [Bacteroidales bacterium]
MPLQILSKNQFKFLSSLKTSKSRKKYNLFIAEGEKLVIDLIQSGLSPHSIVAYPEIFESHVFLEKKYNDKCLLIKEKDMDRLSALKSPSPVFAAFSCWEKDYDYELPSKEWVLLLDQIKDPGNMGTIIRTADWFGIKHIVCTNNCVETFNPKLIQSTMGSIARVNVYHLELTDILNNLNENIPMYGTLLEGKNLYQQQLKPNGYIITGNESKGISSELIKVINHPIHIPAGQKIHAESLNASIATAIVCGEFFRQKNSINE